VRPCRIGALRGAAGSLLQAGPCPTLAVPTLRKNRSSGRPRSLVLRVRAPSCHVRGVAAADIVAKSRIAGGLAGGSPAGLHSNGAHRAGHELFEDEVLEVIFVHVGLRNRPVRDRGARTYGGAPLSGDQRMKRGQVVPVR